LAAPGRLTLTPFVATNEREGSEIARQITTALLLTSMEVVFVTHQYEFARGFHALSALWAYFLRAERGENGARPFKLVERGPLRTSYGEDLYREIFKGAA
jgi:DNA mismatch repair ATPase MutS